KGRYRMAATEFRKILEQRPNYHKAKSGLAQALVAQGKCEEAINWLNEIPRSKNIWNFETASAEGLCRYRMGDDSGALAATEEALILGGGRESNPWYQLAIILMHNGDFEGSKMVLARLSRLGKSDGSVLMGYTWLAYLSSSEDLPIYLNKLHGSVAASGSGRVAVQYQLINGRRWMDLNNYKKAIKSFEEGLRKSFTHARLVSWKAEALRRNGEIHNARYMMNRIESSVSSRLKAAIEARILVDLGKIEEARAKIADQSNSLDADVLASRWYIARGEGNLAEAERYAAWWDEAWGGGNRSLSQLIPVYEEGR
ncbi:MAG: tetratricopeptide repeat protein, partial [Proteobacteria bacterium]|nr:tetratricopeptide repeat protein [Pseudomonadota bacterium]